MSTILDALRKVARERESPREQVLHESGPETQPRRRTSILLIALCAVLGFAAGTGVALYRRSAPSEVASLPELPPPPVIEVPPSPDAAPVADEVAGAAAPGTAATRPEPGATVAAAAAARAPTDEAPQGPSDGSPRLPVAEAQPPPPDDTGHGVSALEPSPFARTAEKPPAAPAQTQVSEPAIPAAPAGDEELAKVLADIEQREVPEPTPPGAAPEPEESEPPEQVAIVDTGRSPPGAPKVSLSFLQWSADPGRRFALVSIDGAPSQRVREGDSAAGMSVLAILPHGVQFRREGTLFVIRPRH